MGGTSVLRLLTPSLAISRRIIPQKKDKNAYRVTRP
nr:MAG TPA: hypothetical protein [Caudoviricetes sp.]